MFKNRRTEIFVGLVMLGMAVCGGWLLWRHYSDSAKLAEGAECLTRIAVLDKENDARRQRVWDAEAEVKRAQNAQEECEAAQKAANTELLTTKVELDSLRQTPTGAAFTWLNAVTATLTLPDDTPLKDKLVAVNARLAEAETFHTKFPASPEWRMYKQRLADLQQFKADVETAQANERGEYILERLREATEWVEDGAYYNSDVHLTVAGLLKQYNLDYKQLVSMPWTTRDKALRYPDAERGRVLIVNGHVAQLRTDAGITTGLLCTEYCTNAYRFVTLEKADGVRVGRTATFAGVFVQKFVYPTEKSASVTSTTLVGYFR
jgi:hypothetical protein